MEYVGRKVKNASIHLQQNANSISSKHEPAIWSRHTGQQIACFGSCQLNMTWILKIKFKTIVMLILSYFSRHWRMTDRRTYVRTVTRQLKLFRSMGYQIFLRLGLPLSAFPHRSSATNLAWVFTFFRDLAYNKIQYLPKCLFCGTPTLKLL